MAITAILSAGLLVGCDKQETARRVAAPATASVSVASTGHPGTITGKVIFAASIPKLEMLATPPIPECDHPAGIPNETVVANANGTLRNVFVYLKGVAPSQDGPAAPAVLDQMKCQYVPHVVAVRAGQTLRLKSSDTILHNVHIAESQPPLNWAFAGVGQHDIALQQRGFFKARCDIHPWMTAWVGVFDNDYFAVTGDDGTFTLANVPPGSYTLEAWHERFGKLSQPVTVAADGATVVDVKYE